MNNVTELPDSGEKEAAISYLLESIAQIRRGEIIGLCVVKTMSDLDVVAKNVLDTMPGSVRMKIKA